MTKRFCIAIIITIVQFFFCFSEAKKDLVQQNSNDRALQLLKQMTLDEKIHMLHGQYGTYVGNVPAIDRLGIPSLNLQDGPQGFRVSKSSVGAAGTTTCWPSALTMSSAWDTDLAFRWASAMGLEFKNKGANVQLAPGLGLARVPTAGRNFEYLSGEDPVLGSMMAEQVVKGIQSNGIIANAKHWVNNEIEDQRRRVSSNVNERTRFEIYYPPFEAAVKAGVLSVMCSYNRINDIYACENPELYSHLRNNLNFTGWVMSDWFATKSTVPSVISGLDQEMPIGLYFSDRELKAKLSSGNITESMLDEKVLRILTSMYTIGLFDSPNTGHPKADVTSDAHNALAREIAAKSTVLLKNENNLLPLNAVELSTYGESSCIAVFGDEQTISGGGSGHVEPAYIVTPTQGIMESIRHKLGPKGDDKLPVYYIDSSKDVETIKAFAEQCKVSVVVVATSSKEGSDRENLSFSQDQNDLVTLVAGANPKGTIVNVRNPGAVLMPWADLVPSILVSWLPGIHLYYTHTDIPGYSLFAHLSLNMSYHKYRSRGR